MYTCAWERYVPADLSVKMLGLVFWASLLLSCSKQCCQAPPAETIISHGKGRQHYRHTPDHNTGRAYLYHYFMLFGCFRREQSDAWDYLPHSLCVEWVSLESGWNCKAVQQHHWSHSVAKEVKYTHTWLYMYIIQGSIIDQEITPSVQAQYRYSFVHTIILYINYGKHCQSWKTFVIYDLRPKLPIDMYTCIKHPINVIIHHILRPASMLVTTWTSLIARVSVRLSITTAFHMTLYAMQLTRLGKTEYVCMSFFGYLSVSLSSRNDPIPDPVPPAIEWQSTNPSRLSLLSASRSRMSNISSFKRSAYTNVQCHVYVYM